MTAAPAPPAAVLKGRSWTSPYLVFELTRPRHLAEREQDLPRDPEGPGTGTFAVTIPVRPQRSSTDAHS